MNATVNTDAIQPGDEIRIAGSRRWLHVVEVFPAGVHVLDNWHAWHRWPRIAAHRHPENSEGGSA